MIDYRERQMSRAIEEAAGCLASLDAAIASTEDQLAEAEHRAAELRRRWDAAGAEMYAAHAVATSALATNAEVDQALADYRAAEAERGRLDEPLSRAAGAASALRRRLHSLRRMRGQWADRLADLEAGVVVPDPEPVAEPIAAGEPDVSPGPADLSPRSTVTSTVPDGRRRPSGGRPRRRSATAWLASGGGWAHRKR